MTPAPKPRLKPAKKKKTAHSGNTKPRVYTHQMNLPLTEEQIVLVDSTRGEQSRNDFVRQVLFAAISRMTTN